jgi:hypothetical protein
MLIASVSQFDSRGGRHLKSAHGLIFTAVYSRHMFVWPTYRQTLGETITGFEAAWMFFGGVFSVVIPDYVARHTIAPNPARPRSTRRPARDPPGTLPGPGWRTQRARLCPSAHRPRWPYWPVASDASSPTYLHPPAVPERCWGSEYHLSPNYQHITRRRKTFQYSIITNTPAAKAAYSIPSYSLRQCGLRRMSWTQLVACRERWLLSQTHCELAAGQGSGVCCGGRPWVSVNAPTRSVLRSA